jgi:hypothetical protein
MPALVSEESPTAPRTRRLVWVGAGVLATGLLIDQLRALLSFGRSYTDQDQTILWYAGRELLRGRFYEPNFFGQRYNTTFEAIPGALLHVAGLPWGTALPAATTLLVTLIWLLFAATAYRLGQPIAALLALAAPLVMRVQYLLLFDAPRGVLAGDCAAALAMAIGLAARRHQIRLFALVAIGGLAILWDYAAALAVVPVLVYTACNDWPRYRRRAGRAVRLVAIAAVPPLAWYLFTVAWWNAHHSYLIYPAAASSLHWSNWVHNFDHLSAYVSYFAPALAPVAGVAVFVLAAGIVLVMVLAVRRRSLALLLANCSLVVLLLLALTSTSAILPGLYLAGSRILLPLPFAVWFLCFAAFDTAKRTRTQGRGVRGPGVQGAAVHARPRTNQNVIAVIAIVVLATISVIVTQINFSSVATRSITPTVGVSVANPTELSAYCAALARVYRSTDAQLLATNNVNYAYACAADDGLNTLIPAYDRRGWLIQASLRQPIQRILVSVPNCNYVDPAAGQCTPEPVNVVLVQSKLFPAAHTLDRITGMHVMLGTWHLPKASRPAHAEKNAP